MSNSGANQIIQSYPEGCDGEAGASSALTNSRTSPHFDDIHGRFWRPPSKYDLFNHISDGLYKLDSPILVPDHGSAYSVDMVRFEFQHENVEKIVKAIDTCTLYNVLETYTSNRIGTYKFMWVIRYADGKQGGGERKINDEETYIDGDKCTVIKIGFGVNSSGGIKKKGFIEFNPNKALAMGQQVMKMLYCHGCDFELKRWDIAIDYGIDRYSLRVMKDKRKYEFHQSNGITEYLGRRNAPGRVKVYDKAAEQDLEDIKVTRVELTCDAAWNEAVIKSKLPYVYAPTAYVEQMERSQAKALAKTFLDMLGYTESLRDLRIDIDFMPVIEYYLAGLPLNARTKVRKCIKEIGNVLPYDLVAIARCKSRAMDIGNGFN